ncbi:MAG: ankyrin repeat domain-containing protein, partial [Alphaproteobacteria bacterium]
MRQFLTVSKNRETRLAAVIVAMCFSLGVAGDCLAQIPPSANMIANYQGLHKAANAGDLDTIQKLVAQGQNLEQRDEFGRTPLHVAAYAS